MKFCFLFYQVGDAFQATGELMPDDFGRQFAIVSCQEDGYRIHSADVDPTLLPGAGVLLVRDGYDINVISAETIDKENVECGLDDVFRFTEGRWQQMDSEGEWVKVPLGVAGHKYHRRSE